VAVTVGLGVTVGDGVTVGLGVTVADAVIVAVTVGVTVAVTVGVAVRVGEGVTVTVTVGVAVTVTVGVAVTVAVGVTVAVPVTVTVGVGVTVTVPVGEGVTVLVAVGVTVGVGVTWPNPPGQTELAPQTFVSFAPPRQCPVTGVSVTVGEGVTVEVGVGVTVTVGVGVTVGEGVETPAQKPPGHSEMLVQDAALLAPPTHVKAKTGDAPARTRRLPTRATRRRTTLEPALLRRIGKGVRLNEGRCRRDRSHACGSGGLLLRLQLRLRGGDLHLQIRDPRLQVRHRLLRHDQRLVDLRRRGRLGHGTDLRPALQAVAEEVRELVLAISQ
jgi:hypothetical protein